jgi:hypothetical protein
MGMGWWKTSEGYEIGDGPLDDAEDFLERVAQAYVEEYNRTPSLAELLHCLKLTLTPDINRFVSDPSGVVLSTIVAKTKTQPKRQKQVPGSVFCVPLSSTLMAFGRLTPQSGLADFYITTSSQRLSARVLQRFPTFRFPTMLPRGPFASGDWQIYDFIEYPTAGFLPTFFLIGAKVTCGSNVADGFIDVSSESRMATPVELESLRPLSISNQAMVEHRLVEALTVHGAMQEAAPGKDAP